MMPRLVVRTHTLMMPRLFMGSCAEIGLIWTGKCRVSVVSYAYHPVLLRTTKESLHTYHQPPHMLLLRLRVRLKASVVWSLVVMITILYNPLKLLPAVWYLDKVEDLFQLLFCVRDQVFVLNSMDWVWVVIKEPAFDCAIPSHRFVLHKLCPR